MRTLIITTGVQDYILNTLLPSLRGKGCYKGDILLIDYIGTKGCFTPKGIKELDDRVIYRKVKNVYENLAIDRYRAFIEYLKDTWMNYDVIMHIDGNDMEFFLPIQELLEIGSKVLSCTQELEDNETCFRYTKWKPMETLPIKYWNSIKNRIILNDAMFLGPAKEMYMLLSLMVEMSKYDTRIGTDQIVFNVLAYHYNIPIHILSNKWDYHKYWGVRYDGDIPYSLYNVPATRPIEKIHSIAILHDAGISGRKDKESKEKIAVIIGTTSLKDERFIKAYNLMKQHTKLNYDLIILESTPYLQGEVFNYPKAMNIIFKSIEADYYILTSADIYVEENWLEALINTAKQDNKIGIVSGLYFFPNGTIHQAGTGKLQWNITDTKDKIQMYPVDESYKKLVTKNIHKQKDAIFVSGALWLITKDCLRKIGMLNEELEIGWGDIEYCLRAWENDLRVVYTPKCRAIHDEASFNKEHYPVKEVYYYQPWKSLYGRWTKEDIENLENKVKNSNKVIESNKFKPLIITTGIEKYIMGRFLPTLRKQGEYEGSVMIIDYDENPFSDKAIEELNKDGNIVYIRTKKEYDSFSSDRHRAFSNALYDYSYFNWDVILHIDGNDIEFFKPIQPLLELGKKGLHCTKEERLNSLCFPYWECIKSFPIEYRNIIENEPIFNAGLFIGPSEEVFKIFNVLDALLRKDSRFGTDQLMYNVLHYCYGLECTVLSKEWGHFIMDKDVKFDTKIPYWKDRKGKHDISILHYTGIYKNKPLNDMLGKASTHWENLANNIQEIKVIEKVIKRDDKYFKLRYPC